MSTAFEKEYARQLPALRRAEAALIELLNGVAASIGDKRLVRAEVRSVRIKELSSLEHKAKAHGWSPAQAFTEASDLIGGRVVCNNVVDVYRFAELLKAALKYGDYFEIEDYIKTPKNGYRALHVNIHLRPDINPFAQDSIAAEVQIRTRLQDAWAELVHGDIYKNADLPEDLRAMGEHLATMLNATETIAGDIRVRVGRLAEVAKKFDPTKVTPEGLAYVFAEVFGNAPPEYVVQEGQNLAKSSGLTSLAPLRTALGRSEFRERLDAAYRKHMRLAADLSDIFFACVVAAAKGDKRGVNWMRRRGKREADEMQAIYEREALSGLPDTIKELLADLESATGAHIDTDIAKVLGATNNCLICGDTIILPDTLAGALVQHYELDGDEADDAYQRIESAILSSDMETGGLGNGNLCSYHNERYDDD